jgi:hypothetical protein
MPATQIYACYLGARLLPRSTPAQIPDVYLDTTVVEPRGSDFSLVYRVCHEYHS